MATAIASPDAHKFRKPATKKTTAIDHALIARKDAAEWLGISLASLDRWAYSGKIKRVKIGPEPTSGHRDNRKVAFWEHEIIALAGGGHND